MTSHQVGGHVKEANPRLPPPVFSIVTLWVVACGFADDVENDSRLVRAVNSGGAALTKSNTVIVCELPAQGLGAAQETTIVA